MTLSFLRASLARVRGAAIVFGGAALVMGALSGCAPPPLHSISVTNVPFPGPSNFQGGFVPEPGPVTNGGQSDYSGTIVVTMVDRNLVNSVLPAGTSLAPTMTPSSMHPVIYLMGFQGKLSAVDNGQVIPTLYPGYREMSLLIPFVVLNNGANWHNYVVRMYLPPDAPVEILGGNLCCGYHKVPAFLDYQRTGSVSNHAVQTWDLLSTWFTDTISRQGPYVGTGQAGGAVPRLADLQTIFQMPILGSSSSGNFICTYWDWNFSQAKVAPAASAFQFVNPFTSGMYGWTALGTLTNAANGAVAIRHLRWRLDFSQASAC
jgi:hypothetical protein